MESAWGKRARSPAPRLVFQTIQAFLEEAFPPLRGDPPRHVQELRDLLVIKARSGHEAFFWSAPPCIRCCVFPGVLNEKVLLCTRKRDDEGTVA
jgi:hypothetical protein